MDHAATLTMTLFLTDLWTLGPHVICKYIQGISQLQFRVLSLFKVEVPEVDCLSTNNVAKFVCFFKF